MILNAKRYAVAAGSCLRGPPGGYLWAVGVEWRRLRARMRPWKDPRRGRGAARTGGDNGQAAGGDPGAGAG